MRQPLVGITDVPSRAARTNSAAPATILQLLNSFPQPTGPDRSNGFAEFAASFSNPTTLNAASLRIDHTLNSKLTFFARITSAPSETITRTGDGLRSLNNSRLIRVETRTLTAAATFLLSPSSTNDFRFNYSRLGGIHKISIQHRRSTDSGLARQSAGQAGASRQSGSQGQRNISAARALVTGRFWRIASASSRSTTSRAAAKERSMRFAR